MGKPLLITELATHLNNYLAISTFDESTYNGIQVAHTPQPITKVATAVSASLETIEKAVALKAQVLITHHGILSKQKPHPLTETLYKKVKALIDHNIALLVYHLPLDAHHEIGNNWKAAQDLGLGNLKPCIEFNKVPIGVIGTIEPTPFASWKTKVESYYDNKAAAVAVKDTIKTVAIVSGGADRFLKDVAALGADCFITGRFDEPVWDDAHEGNISFLGLGHYATETVGPKALAEYIHKTYGIEALFIKTDNPF